MTNGFAMLFWAIAYEAYNFIRNPDRRWEADCAFCDETKRARSKNMALTKDSLHIHLTDDDAHPDGPEDVDYDWGKGASTITPVSGSEVNDD